MTVGLGFSGGGAMGSTGSSSGSGAASGGGVRPALPPPPPPLGLSFRKPSVLPKGLNALPDLKGSFGDLSKGSKFMVEKVQIHGFNSVMVRTVLTWQKQRILQKRTITSPNPQVLGLIVPCSVKYELT
jgi:hypothetical protein